jgi:hypothetical protein
MTLEAGSHELTKADSRNVFYIGVFYADNSTTGIGSISLDEAAQTLYDLQGRKVRNIAKPGLYILNGKKVLVK